MSSVTYQIEFRNRKSDIDSLVQKNPNNKELLILQSQCAAILKKAQMDDNSYQEKLQHIDNMINQHELSSIPVVITTHSNETPF